MAWTAASVPFFFYIAVVGLLLPGVRSEARARALAGAAAGALLALGGGYTSAFWLQLLVLPLAVLLLAYWTSGLLWVAPMERLERLLVRSDAVLRVSEAARSLPRALVEILELAYAGVYPLIPIAFALHLWSSPAPDPDRFWTVILVTDFVCFGMLPWVQTRPPRALEAGVPWRSALRSLNVKLLGKTSTGVNTLPSGHAAEAFAAALLVADAPWPVAGGMWIAALAVSAAAVLGRYHYAIDAFTGWAVAVVVWAIAR